MAGLTADGFQIKRLAEIKTELEEAHRAAFGNAFNIDPSEPAGQLIGIYAEREALLWELMQALYNTLNPDAATGVNLDIIAALTGAVRLEATFSQAEVVARGVQGTVIPAGSQVSVEGDPEAVFESQAEAIIGDGVDEVQDISFSDVPVAGEFTLIFDGEETAAIQFNDNAAAVEAALEALNGIDDVDVVGDFAGGFTVAFVNASGDQDQPLILEGNTNTLEDGGAAPITIDIVESVAGDLPSVTFTVFAVEAGRLVARAGTLTVIETPVPGWSEVTNPADAVEGRDLETDAEFRLRRFLTLAEPGCGTVDAIRAEILKIDDVRSARVFQNIEFVVDAAGRPPKSVEAVVLGGSDEDVANALFVTVSAGIEQFGDETFDVIDSQGFTQTMRWNRPDEIDIWLEVDLTTNDDFPVDGDVSVEEKILEFVDTEFLIGDDVVTSRLYCPIHEVDGIDDIVIRIGLAPGPVGDANIPIGEREIAVFDSARTTINIL